MIRDTFFDWHRFVNVCRKEMVEGWKANLLRMVLIYGVLAIPLIWNACIEYRSYSGRELDVERAVWTFGGMLFLWGIVVMGSLSASFTMERMKTKTGRISTLMTPATMFEKFFARWLVFTFGFLVVYLVAYKLADWTRVLVLMVKYPEVNTIAQLPLGTYLVGGGEDVVANSLTAFLGYRSFMAAMGGYFFLQSCYVLGSSIWPKNAFLKTFAIKMLLVVAYTLVGAMLAGWLIKGGNVDLDLPSYSQETALALVTAFSFALALFNWVLAYFRFKESEIINRW